MTGVAVATQSLDVHWHDTYFVVAHFHFIMVGGTLTAFLAALHYWFPKMTGRMYPERWGMPERALVFAGFFATFFPQFLLGNAGMPRRYYNYPPQFQVLHVALDVGSWVLGAACCSRSPTSCVAPPRRACRRTTRGARAPTSGTRLAAAEAQLPREPAFPSVRTTTRCRSPGARRRQRPQRRDAGLPAGDGSPDG